MTYELAKKLKDAGFLMPTLRELDITNTVVFRREWACFDDEKEIRLYPTLSELIEACEEKGELVINVLKGYSMARIVGRDEGADGSTPEEAVANLWITLNPSKVVYYK